MDAIDARRRRASMRTAKLCGPDAPTLVSTRDNANALRGDGGKKARSPGRARRKPLKPSRRECRLMRRTCGDYACVLFPFAHKAAGAAAHPAFPAPSAFRRGANQRPGRLTVPREGRVLAFRSSMEIRRPHHILHKYHAATASAWPWPGDVVSRKYSFDRHN